MNPDQNEIEDEDVTTAVSTLMKELPKPMQDFLTSDERGNVIRELSSKYSLHVDQAGEFERAFIFMLLGISKPEEFVATLAAAGLGQEVINGLAADVNTRVFMRLRDQERQAVQAQPQKPAPLPPPALTYGPALTLPGSPVTAPMPVAQEPAPVLATVEPTPVPHVVQAMPQSAAQPGWHSAAAVHIYVPSHPPVAQPAQAQPVQPAPPAVMVRPPVYANPETTTQPAPVVENPPTKAYVADPYRESV